MNKQDVKHIAMVRLSAIGDVILFIPLVRTLQAHFPHAKLTWIIDKSVYPMVEGLSGVDFIVIHKPKGIRDYLRFRKQMRHYHFDVLLATQASYRANFLYPFIRAKRKIGFDYRRAQELHFLFVKEKIKVGDDHILEGFLRFAEKLGITDPVIKWDLPLSEKDKLNAESLLPKGEIIAINPRASKEERNWLLDRYITLIQEINQRYHIPVVLTGGPQDKSFTDEIAKKSDVIDLVGKTNLKQLACVLSKVTVLISPDTGPAHIATAVGTPVIGLYGVASFGKSGPYLSREYVIDKFQEGVVKLLKKDPSTLSWYDKVHHPDIMALITVDDVLSKLNHFFPLGEPV